MRFYAGPRLLIIDELGYSPLASEAAAALFQVTAQRYLKGSVALTTRCLSGRRRPTPSTRLLADRGLAAVTGALVAAAPGPIVRRLARPAGIRKAVAPHSLRHSFVTLALAAGVPLRDVHDSASRPP